MIYVLLIGALAVGGVGLGIRRRSAFWGQALVIAGCVGCVAVIAWQVRENLFPSNVKPPNRAHAVVGFFLASQAQREIAGQAGTVVLALPPTSILDSETAETYVNAFRAPLLRGHPELQVQVATFEVAAKEAKSGVIPLTSVKQAVEKHPNALAFVCFASLPAGIETLSTDPAKVPPILAFDASGSTNWVTALVQRRLRCVIVPRPNVNPNTAGDVAGMPGEIFGRLYYLATPDTAEQIAAALGQKPAPSGR
jgi:hypothetical protein